MVKKAPRFHLIKRDEQDIDSNYVHRVLVLLVDGDEIELNAKEANNLIDLLSEGRTAMGWQPIEIPIPHKTLVDSVMKYDPDAIAEQLAEKVIISAND